MTTIQILTVGNGGSEEGTASIEYYRCSAGIILRRTHLNGERRRTSTALHSESFRRRALVYNFETSNPEIRRITYSQRTRYTMKNTIVSYDEQPVTERHENGLLFVLEGKHPMLIRPLDRWTVQKLNTVT